MEKRASDVKQERESRGWSQQDLAKRAHVSIRTIRRLESGENVADATCAKVLKALQLDGAPMQQIKEPIMRESAIGVRAEPQSTPAVREVEGNADAVVAAAPAVTNDETSTATGGADGVLLDGGGDTGTPLTLTAADGQTVVIEDPPTKPSFRKLTSGFDVVRFIEQFPDAPVLVTHDPTNEDERAVIRAFIEGVANMRDEIVYNRFGSVERFDAQCLFADQVETLRRAEWVLRGGTKYSPDWNQTGWVLLDYNGLPF